jgi:hypothetical protein
VGAPQWSGPGYRDFYEGRAYLFLGSATGFGAAPVWTADPANEVRRYFGAAVAGLGDVNGDGYGDAMIGEPQSHGLGAVYYYAGSATGLRTTYTRIAGYVEVTPVDSSEHDFGAAVAGAGAWTATATRTPWSAC